LIDLDSGSQLTLENVVLDITVDPTVEIDSSKSGFIKPFLIALPDVLLQFFRERDLANMNGYRLPRYDKEGMIVSRNWCVLNYIGGSPDCFTEVNCNALSRCPNGGLYIYSVTYQFPNNPVLQASYSISNSLLKVQRVSTTPRDAICTNCVTLG